MDSSDDSDDSPELETLDVSNDKHYQQVSTAKPRISLHEDFLQVPIYGSPTIKHSLPAYDLWRPFFPTYLSVEKFRNFHRPKLRHYNTGPQALRHRRTTKAFPIKNLSRQLYRSQKYLRNRIVRAINSGMSRDEIVSKLLLIRRAKDLTAKKGELFLFEYSEENPPVLSQIGMASNVKTYVNPGSGNPRLQGTRQILMKTNQNNVNSPPKINTTSQEKANNVKDSSSLKPECILGTREILSDKTNPKQIYFSSLKPGTEAMFIENNLYRAPIYPHQVDECDFLIIRTRNNIYVRSFHKIFAVGQTMPLTLIPRPTETAISKFRASLSNLYINKLFKESDHDPPAIGLNNLAKLFPDYNPSMLRKRMSQRGVKATTSGLYHQGTSKYGLNSLLEDRSIVKPEEYCLNMSMLANRQRLRELNYSESMILPRDSAELETEVLAAPWNTSRAIHEAMLKRCYLDLKAHLIDPTGPRREGFSCVTWVKSPTEEEQRSQQKNPSTQPTQAAQLNLTNPMAYKIRREKLERSAVYFEAAKLISNVQSDVLGSSEVLSSDEGSDIDENEENDSDNAIDRQLQDLHRLVVDGRSIDELNFEKEEEERRNLISSLNCSGDQAGKNESALREKQFDISQYKNKVLRIVRTYNSPDGPIQRVEVVREPQIIAKYCQEKQSSELSHQEPVVTAKTTLPTLEPTASPLPNEDSLNSSFRRSSLGPTELCRADGTILTISKKVLQLNRPQRRLSRDINNSFHR